ncbi:aquaporin AQPcic isoform X2 [Halyomorpha halys]|uniref:aquaporin AQPcic isoform X2 n=1 Tax=Halyomorpha halys TaxID=286706 RepID=UPI0006D50096|nr:aquaporin AQPcic-like isoform X2 [Halyomorpha halys]
MSFVNNINFDFKCSLFKEKNEKEKDELIYKFVQVFVGEFLGTGMLVFWGCACSGEVNEGGQTIKALMFGIIFGLCIQLIGPEEMSFYGLVKIKNFCVTSVIAEVGIAKTLFWEASGTGTLCLMICSILDTKNRDRIETIPIKLTLCVFTMVYICLPYTGGSINPARSIGPALWHMVFADHWVYWIGPLIGSLFVTVLYHLIFLPKDEDQRISLSTVGLKSPLPTGKKV